jgi:hypothetical protein
LTSGESSREIATPKRALTRKIFLGQGFFTRPQLRKRRIFKVLRLACCVRTQFPKGETRRGSL